MSRARPFTLSESDYLRLCDAAMACRALESLLMSQDADTLWRLNPIHLAALVGLVAESTGQVVDGCPVRPAGR